MATNELRVRIVGDSRSLEQSLTKSTRSLRGFNEQVGRGTKFNQAFRGSLSGIDTRTSLLFGSGAFIGASTLTAALKGSVDAASALNEQVSASRVIFGSASREVEDYAKTTARSLGISRTEALKATATFGGLFDTVGIQGNAAADLSKQLVTLAGDLASFRDADPSDVLDAIRSGLIGEAEPMRRYGALLSEARVQQVALSQTGKTLAKTLTDEEKVRARVAIILQDTVKAQGDAARTAESQANQERRLAASVKDLQANLGLLLLPTVTKVTGALVDATDAALIFSEALAKISEVRIPPITIPIVGEFGGGDIGGAVGGFLSNALDPKSIALRLHPAGLVADTALELKKLFDRDADLVIPKLSKDITDTFDSLLTDALKGIQPKTPTVNPADFAKLPGVDFDRAGLITGAVDDVIKGAQKALDDATRNVKKGLRTQEINEAFEKMIASLELGVDRATLTKTLTDDLAALRALKAGLERQVRAGVDVDAAQRQLVQVTRDIADTQAQINTNLENVAKARLQSRQFRALGLSAAGDEIIPGVENLRKQLEALSKSVVGEDVPRKLLNRLAGVRKLLSGEFGKLTDETRGAIRDLFETIRGEFDEGTKGPLTKTSSLNTNKILEGLGLGRDMEKELRARLSSFNTAGLSLAGATRPTGSFVGTPTAIVENHNTIVLDGDVVGRNITRSQQKNTRRNPRQKRGPNGGV